MKNKFNWRAFICFGLVYSFAVILVSGIILYVAPPGRYAHRATWEILGLTKDGWQALHIIFSFSFVILSVFHLLTANRKIFWSYLKSKTRSGLNKKKELLTATLLFLVFFAGILFSVPPFKSIIDFKKNISFSWEKAGAIPTVRNAESMTIADLARQPDFFSVKEITDKLDKYQIVYRDINSQTLQEIAELNSTTPLGIYRKIAEKPLSQLPGKRAGRQKKYRNSIYKN